MRWTLVLAALMMLFTPHASAGTKYKHEKYFKHYEGTKTCLKCHQDEAEAFFHSQHYQWRGDTPQLVNAHGARHGKMTMINDFCTNPQPNWIGEVRNAEGTVLAKGCSGCHAGLGKLPSAEMSREQLENIDCLVCHASGYRKSVYRNEAGDWEWRPILWKNQEGLDSVSKRISLPTTKMCLRCHASSGGGPNFKRGDIEYALADCEPSFDVHMGNGMMCADCHAGEDHRVRGRGVDLAGTDTTSGRLTCDNDDCHGAEPHDKELLNRHGTRVNCTVCHIPSFAQEDPTDMHRDWSTTSFNEDKGKHAPKIELASDVVPVVAWFNGKTWAQLPGEAVRRGDDGAVEMIVPQGSREDPEARLHAFKVHRGRLPVLSEQQWLLPITTEEFYVHGDMDRAVREAAEVYYDIHDADFEWVDTIRYMGIFHEVRPADQALRCLDCHSDGGRIDWQGLGYEADPLVGCLESED